MAPPVRKIALMIASKNSHPANVAQIDKFKQAARDLECDEDEEAFKRSLRAIAKAPVERKAKAK